MELVLSDILQMEIFQHSHVVAGNSGINNTVSFATVMDVPDIVKWLRGGEILLVANLFDTHINSSFLLDLKTKSVSAIITKEKYAAHLDGELKAMCETLRLPIIAVPNETSWGDILNPITQMVAEIQYQAIYQSQLLHASLMNFMIDGLSLELLCGEIYEHFNLSIALADGSFSLLSCSPDVQWHRILDGFTLSKATYENCLGSNIKGKNISGYVYDSPLLREAGQRIFIFPVVRSRINYGYILDLVSMDVKHVTVSEIMKIDQISQVLALDCMKKQELSNTVRRYNNLLLDRILSTDSLGKNGRAEIERLLNLRMHEQYHVALTSRADTGEDIYTQNRRIFHLFSDIAACPDIFKGILCFERGNRLVFFVPADVPDIRAVLEQLYERCRIHIAPMKFGVSEATGGEFLKAYNQALQVNRYMERYSDCNICFYADLGLLRFFMDKGGALDTDFLRDIKKRYLLPLEHYDEEKNTQLKQTLIMYVLSNGSVAKTIQALYIHKNTLYTRLRRIEAVLDVSLESNEDLFNIQLAIKLDQLQASLFRQG